MWFNSFDEVVKRYNETKPIVSNKHTKEQDIRPAGYRHKKWERIVKYDDNTYALTDGNYDNSLWHNNPNKINPEYAKAMSPILWERRKDGDYVTFRNGTVGSAHISRYKFLSFYTPAGIDFSINMGRQYILLQNGMGFELPKTTYRWDWHSGKVLNPDDGMKLCFKVLGDRQFERVGDPLPVTTKVIDKEVKKQHKGIIKEFFDWLCVTVPMMDNTWRGRDEYRTMLKQWMQENNKQMAYYSPQLTDITAELGVEIMTNFEHPMRLCLASLINQTVQIHEATEEADVKRIKARYNSAINKLLNLYKTELV